MDPQVQNLLTPLRIRLLPQVRLVLVTQKLHHGLVALLVVHVVAKPRHVNHRQLNTESLLLNLRTDNLNLGRLVHLLATVACGIILLIHHRRREERVDERGLAQTLCPYHVLLYY